MHALPVLGSRSSAHWRSSTSPPARSVSGACPRARQPGIPRLRDQCVVHWWTLASARRIWRSIQSLKACGVRWSVLFSSAADLLDELVAAEVSHNLGKALAHLRRVDL